jgi:hypothetical protein
MRNEKNGFSQSVAEGITPCARGDSLLKTLTEAEKFAGGASESPQHFSPDSASMFSPTDLRLMMRFEAERNQ